MTYTVTTTMTKPAGTQWHGTANPTNQLAIANWELAQLGTTLLYKISIPTSDTTMVTTEVFVNEAAYNQFWTAKQALPEFQTGSIYIETNKIEVTRTTSGS